MKSTFKIALCASVLILAAGCGKSKSGGGSNSGIQFSNLTDATSQQVATAAQAWYNSPTDAQVPSIGQHNVTRTVSTYSDNNGCKTKTVLGFIDLNLCFNSNRPASQVDNSAAVNILVNQVKSANPKLVQAMNGGILVQAREISGFNGAPAYQLEFQKPNGNLIRYTIDTGYNSAVNPMMIEDSEARTIETVTKIQ